MFKPALVQVSIVTFLMDATCPLLSSYGAEHIDARHKMLLIMFLCSLYVSCMMSLSSQSAVSKLHFNSTGVRRICNQSSFSSDPNSISDVAMRILWSLLSSHPRLLGA